MQTWHNGQRYALRPRATFDVPSTDLLPSDTDRATVVSSNHELDGFMFGQVDEPAVVDHEHIPTTVLEWFTVEVAVDVVFNFTAARQVNVIGPDGRYLVNRVADCVQPWFGFSVRLRRQ
jgi:hypothetical protein